MDQPTFVEGFHDPEAVKKMTYHPLGNTGKAYAFCPECVAKTH